MINNTRLVKRRVEVCPAMTTLAITIRARIAIVPWIRTIGFGVGLFFKIAVAIIAPKIIANMNKRAIKINMLCPYIK
jgi:hypothetical protein